MLWAQRLRDVVLAASLMGYAAPVMAQEATARGPIAIGVGIERFGIIFNRPADFYDGSASPDFGRTLPNLVMTVPVTARFAVQGNVAYDRRQDIAGDHTEVMYALTVNHRLGRLSSRSFQPYITYGLSGLRSRRVVPASTEWYLNGSTWEERVREAYTIRHHSWPTRPVAGAGFQYQIWKGLATRVEAELLGPSAARVRTSLMVPMGGWNR